VTPAFWRGRRAFITGHTGFKGSWLALWLDRLGARVTGYGLAPPTSPSLYALVDIGSHIESTSADIRNLDELRRSMRDTRPEIIFHLAAQSLVRESYRSPIDTLTTNVIGTANLLEAIRSVDGIRAVVVVTSDKCYENREQEAGYRETDCMGGHDPYSGSKGAAELITSSYRRSFFHATDSPAIATARAGNVIGGGDFATDRLLPDCIRAVEAGRQVSIRNPEATRPWQFVLEPLAGYMKLAEQLTEKGQAYAEPWNFGPAESETLPVRWVCEEFAKTLHARSGRQLRIEFSRHSDGHHEAKSLRLDISKTKEKLHWNPVLPTTDAVALTASWYSEYLKNGDLCEVTLSQIDQFQSTMMQRKSMTHGAA
jgi:CDP-glucose 4,6-dehydratase